MSDGNVFRNIRLAHHRAIVRPDPSLADEECGRLLGGVAIFASEDMCVGLQKEPNIGVPDPLADHLGLIPALSAPVASECRRSWNVIRDSPAAAARRSKRCLIVSGCGGRPSSKVKT